MDPSKMSIPTNMLRNRLKSVVKISFVNYCIRLYNPIPLKLAKWTYVFLLSPLLLTRALLTPDEICLRYRRFLMSFTYPEKNIVDDNAFSSCATMHKDQPACGKAFVRHCMETIRRIFRMYLRLYIMHGIVLLLVLNRFYTTIDRTHRKKTNLTNVLRFELYNTLRSTAFLSGQTLLQRSLLCLATKYKVRMTQKRVYAMSIVGSLPVLFERDFRTQQVNNLVLSHLAIGYLRKRGWMDTGMPWWLFGATVVGSGVNGIALLISLLTSFTTF